MLMLTLTLVLALVLLLLLLLLLLLFRTRCSLGITVKAGVLGCGLPRCAFNFDLIEKFRWWYWQLCSLISSTLLIGYRSTRKLMSSK